MAIQWIAPIYIIYLFLLTFWPWTTPSPHWKGGIGFIEIADIPHVIPTLRVLEHVAAFTLLGYMVAESRGRKEDSFRYTMIRVILSCLTCSCLLELARGFHPGHNASLTQLIFSIGVGSYGGLIYILQLKAIKRFMGNKN